MNIKELDLDYWELDEVRLDNLDSFSEADAPTFIWTPLTINKKGIDAYVLNILAPLDHCFWNFNTEYWAFSFGEHASAQYVVKNEKAKTIIKDFISEAGYENNSFFSEVLLGGITRFFGDYFIEDSEDYWQVRIRNMYHRSIFVPTEIRPYVYDYYSKQLDQFEETSFIQCEYETLKNVDYDALVESVEAQKLQLLFLSDINKITDDEKEEIIAYIKNDIFIGNFPKELNYLLNIDYINLVYPYARTDAQTYQYFDLISNYRAKWAANNLCCTSLESIKNQINDKIWGALEISFIRNELRKIIDKKLSQYPIIQTNPYEQFIPGKYLFAE